jgi:hypothetical protein
MRRNRHARTPGIGLDSLVDIVSNTVGILIILAVFVALFSRLSLTGSGARPERAVPLEEPLERLLVPWSHATNKTAVFAHAQGNRLRVLDLREFYARLANRGAKPGSGPLTIDLPGLETRFYPVTNLVYCLEFRPEPEYGETLRQLRRADSAWQATLAGYPGEKFYYFFWVAGDSFELFRAVRQELWERQIEVGWKPVPSGAPLEICNGFDGSTAFQPQ